MSFSIELKINGHPIITIVGHNEYTDCHGVADYKAQGVSFDQHGEPRSFMVDIVKHQRSEGLMALAAKVLVEAVKLEEKKDKQRTKVTGSSTEIKGGV